MKLVYHLSSCDTCRRIINQLQLKEKGFQLQDIKTEKISKEQLEAMKLLSGSFEAIFSRTSRKFKEQNLAAVKLTEPDFKRLILEEYTFLKRPVIIFNKKIFIGNSKEVVEEALKIIV